MSSQDDFFAIDLDDSTARASSAEERPDPNQPPPPPGSPPAPRNRSSVLDLDETVFEGATGTEAEYETDSKVRCPSCRKMIGSVQIVRLSRARVSFVSTLPRRGCLAVCPSCRAVLPAELGGLLL